MTTATNSVAGVESPAPGNWTIDPGHAELAFVGRHLGLTKIRGRFTGVEGTVQIADDLEDSTVEVTVDMASVHSGDDTRDEHLRSADLFDTGTHPTAHFRSTKVDVSGTSGTVTGELTIKGVTRTVDLDVSFLGSARDPWENDRAVFTAATTINREDWGLTWNMLLETGGILVSKEIRIEVDVELITAA